METFEPTTLVTFFFKAPREVRVVELLGSWDGFTKAYRMRHDRRRGTGYWSGCFKFENIIFDGDRPHWTRPRSGGLKQGGKYWFYYRLNDELEAYDDSRECTADCPLLPGQTVNVMEVPTEIVEPPSRCRSASADVAGSLVSSTSLQTLNPDDKFAVLRPTPVSRVHGRCISDLALNGRLESCTPFSRRSVVSPLESSHSAQARPTSMGSYVSKRRCFEDRSSCISRQSRRSTALSSTHSSVVDAYIDLGSMAESGSLSSFPLPPGTHEHASAVDGAYLESYQSDLELPRQHVDSTLNANNIDSASQQHPPSDQTNHPENPTSPQSSTGAHHHFLPLPDPDLDYSSPTFSAATVSSGGLNTPYRLSIGYSSVHERELDDVASRLQALNPAGRSPSEVANEDSMSTSFQGYALPAPAMESAQSLGKLKSSLEQQLPVQAVLSTSPGRTSMVEDIFSELGYLGGSIS